MNIEELTFHGDPLQFEALKLYLHGNAPTIFEDVINKLDEALNQYSARKAFEPIAKYLRFVVDDPYGQDDSIYINGEIQSHIDYFSINPKIVKTFKALIDYLKLPEENIYLTEDFLPNAMDEYDPVMIMIVHGDHQYAGLIIKCRVDNIKWVMPTKEHMKNGFIGWRSFKDFTTGIDFLHDLIMRDVN